MCMQYKLSKGVCTSDLVNLVLVVLVGWATYYPSIHVCGEQLHDLDI